MILQILKTKEGLIAGLALLGIALYGLLNIFTANSFVLHPAVLHAPLYIVIIFGGSPLLIRLARNILELNFGSDLLAGISIITSLILQQPLAGSLVVLMLSGGEALEQFAAGRASSVLKALSERTPQKAHRSKGDHLETIAVEQIQVGDRITIFPHEVCPVDGVVIEGHGEMDESFLTGEPFQISKAPGAEVISGAINGENLLIIRATKLTIDSRYEKIVHVLKESQTKKLSLRRLGDQLGAIYTPIALSIAIIAWILSTDPTRFLSVIVVATPCPLIIAIPVAIIGAVSLSAARGIIIRDPVVLEQTSKCRTIILDKTGTLTQGIPELTEEIMLGDCDKEEILSLVASLERYSKHPLATAICRAAEKRNLILKDVKEIRVEAGIGLYGEIEGQEFLITSRKIAEKKNIRGFSALPNETQGLECLVIQNDYLVALYKFKDVARPESRPFISHLDSQHNFQKIMLVSGDRESEVKYLAESVGINEVYAGQSPEQKLNIVRNEKKKAPTLFIGDGINDAPALMEASVGLAFGHQSDITSESAGAVIMDTSLEKVDEFFHIASRMRRIALQSALGGMGVSVIGMGFAAYGLLSPVFGALLQEAIDLVAVLNALRAAKSPKNISDFR
jgi:heavy metal translocating P-type ATPase